MIKGKDSNKISTIESEIIFLEDYNAPVRYNDLLTKNELKNKQIKLYIHILNLNPSNAEIYYNFGTFLLRLNKLQAAKKFIQKAISIKTNYVEAISNLSVIELKLNRLKEAEQYSKIALKLDKKFENGYCNLGNIYKEQEKLEDAEQSYRKAISIKNDFVIAYSNLSLVLKEKNNIEDAIYMIKKAINIDPSYLNAYIFLSDFYREIGELQKALKILEYVITKDKSNCQAYNSLGLVYAAKNELNKSITYISKALKINPMFQQGYSLLGQILIKLGRLDDAINILNQGIANEPNDRHARATYLECSAIISNWKVSKDTSKWIKDYKIIKNISPIFLLYFADDPKLEYKFIKKYFKTNYLRKSTNFQYIKKDRIKIGYFSNSFYCHSEMIVFIRVIELCNKDKFEIFIYDFGYHDDDEYTKRIRLAADKYKRVNTMSDSELIEQARKDEIDIAFDLMGYTFNNRASIFSRRVAPIQINYLGWGATTGNPSIDYLIADKTIIPKQDEKYYVEKIIHMPIAHIRCDDTLVKSKKVFRRSELGINDDAFVYCCFSQSKKIQYQDFKLWMELLLENKDSCLWLLETNQISKRNMIKTANDLNVDQKRIIFSKSISIKEHMSRLDCADLMLDTFNFSSCVMTSLALKSGLPVLTCPGKTFSSRLSASILDSLDLDELIATSKEDYKKKAINFSQKKNITLVKNKLITLNASSPYFNSKTYCNDFEITIERIVKDYKNKQKL